MSKQELTIKDRLEDILESIELIEEWSQGMTELQDFMITPGRPFMECVISFPMSTAILTKPLLYPSSMMIYLN